MVLWFNSCYILIFQIEKIFCHEKLRAVIICILYVKVVFIVVFIAYVYCNSFIIYNVWDCFLFRRHRLILWLYVNLFIDILTIILANDE